MKDRNTTLEPRRTLPGRTGGMLAGGLLAIVVSVAVLGLAGCQGEADKPGGGGAAIDGTPYLLTAAPTGARDVKLVHKEAADQQEVVIVGKIGGRLDPWISGRAAFTIVDPSVKSCSDIEGDKCPTPWDYCCTKDDLPGATALVKVVDSSGSILKSDARKLWQLKELQTVVVKGTASRDDKGNLTVLASGIYVKK